MAEDKLKIKIRGDKEYLCPDISYDNFTENSTLYKFGSSDTEYNKYLRMNNMKNITDFNSAALNDAVLIVEDIDTGRIVKFVKRYDSDDAL